MKFYLTLLMFGLLQVSAAVLGQNATLRLKNAPITEVFEELQRQTGYDFLYMADDTRQARLVTIQVKDAPLEKILQLCFADQPLFYTVNKNTVLVKRKVVANPMTHVVVQGREITGVVTTVSGEPLHSVNVVVKGAKTGVYTGEGGRFSIKVPSDAPIVLVFSMVGFLSQEISVKNNQEIRVKLAPEENVLEEVQVNTGLFTRNKSSFTGATSVFSGEELKQVSNGSVIQGLKSLDPSFIVTANNPVGSNPNVMPKIELRGKSSVPSTSSQLSNQFANDPNQPLFILDGFETTLQQVVDMDVNRIASITILKDAASTAIYGGKASNGVVVIETKKPKAGQLRVSYNNDIRFELPDLTSYNMMNARENLEFQRLSYFYTDNGGNNYTQTGHYRDSIYNERLKEVDRGVDTYWLSEPLRSFGLTENNSINLNGGAENFQFDMGLNYRLLKGLMKGSDRDAWGGNVQINYRVKKINFTNNIFINGYSANESPYGSFSQYVNLNPFLRKYDDRGQLVSGRYLFEPVTLASGGAALTPVANPFYNALLTSRNRNNTYTINDNFAMIWDVNSDFRMQAGGQILSENAHLVQFTSPEHTDFDGTPINQRGQYRDVSTRTLSYQFNAMASYARVFNGVHSITANLRGDIQNTDMRMNTFEAIGFPAGANPNPYYATQYALDSRPDYASTTLRSVSLLGSANYSYDNKYLFDVSYRANGTSVFGSDKQFAPFYAFGIGWNVNRESFLASTDWINQIRLRANYGVTGNQNLGSFTSQSVYSFYTNPNIYGVGLDLNSLGRPDLDWQKTKDLSTGIDASLWNNRFNMTFNYYHKVTDPLVLNIDIPSSTGFTNTNFNAGNLTSKGMELNVNYSPIYDLQRNIVWTVGVMGARTKSKYGGGISDLLASFNDRMTDDLNNNNSWRNTTAPLALTGYLGRYYDGYSPDDVWAVQSLGIDPSLGQELFLKADGRTTATYDANDAVRLGSSQPVIQGVVNTTLSIKNFSLGFYMRYSLGAYIANTALFNKAENIGAAQLVYNQDKRALERWKEYGELAPFKRINLGAYTPISSRFIQKENYIAGESISMGYELNSSQYRFLNSAGIKSLRVTTILNDIFRTSNILSERGTDYPYNRVVSFSVNANF